MIRQNIDLKFSIKELKILPDKENEPTTSEIEELNKTNSDKDTAEKIETLITEFSRGNLSITDAKKQLTELGIKYSVTTGNGTTTLTFSYNDKLYVVTSNKNLTLDKKPTILTPCYSKERLLELGFLPEDIEKYFQVTNNTSNNKENVRYTFTPVEYNGKQCNSPEELAELLKTERENAAQETTKNFNTEDLFKNKTELTAQELYIAYNTLKKTSKDNELVKILDQVFEDYECGFSIANKITLLNAIIRVINDKNGIENTAPPKLSKETFESFNNDKGLEQLEKILQSNAVSNCYKLDLDGIIGDFRQGNENDCWLLAGLIALNSSPQGKEIIKNAIKWNDDYSKVTVKLKDNKEVVITAEEFAEFKSTTKHARGDADVIIIELAFKKEIGTLSGLGNDPLYKLNFRNAGSFFTWFCDFAERERHTSSGVDDLFSALGGFFGIGSGKTDLNDKNVKKYLNQIYKNMQNGNYDYYAATFALFSSGKATYKCPTIDGGMFECKLDKTAHVLAITNITKDTVTFVNPWDSSEEYTVTWDNFAKMGIAQMSVSYFQDPEENEFLADGKEYNINNILNNKKPTYLTLTSKTKNYKEAAKSAIKELETIMESIKANLSGFEQDKIDRACETVLNFYKAVINSGTVRDKNGTVGNSFSYYDSVNKKWVHSNEKSDMRSAWDHKDVNSGSDIAKKSTRGTTGIYIGHDKESGGGHGNDKFYIYIDAQEMLNRLMTLLK